MQARQRLTDILKNANLTEEQLRLVEKATRRPHLQSAAKGPLAIPQKHVRIGIVGDTHLNSHFENLPFLHALYREFKTAGCDFVIQTGDLTDGEHMHPGHEYEIKEHGIDRVMDYVIQNYPDSGLITKFIGGNHDESYIKRSGADICKLIARERKDMQYLGSNRGTVLIGDEKNPTRIDIVHPGGGSAKALSYKTQKIVSEIEPADKPQILVLGHYHKFDYLLYRNVHVYQAGTTQSQSDWMARMNLLSHLAGWLVDVYLRKDGTVDRIEQQELWADKLL